MGARSNEWNQSVARADFGMRTERNPDWPFVGSGDMVHVSPIKNDARQVLAQRIQRFCAMRQENFGEMIHDAPFNLLIDMYLSECRDRRVSVGDACLASRAPQTTALRAIQALVDAGTIVRADDSRDNRRKLLSLTKSGREQIARFIDRFAASGGFQAV
jgi:hypothetical protein